jgi:hypothetical protein
MFTSDKMVRKQFLFYLHFFTGSTDEVILLKPEKKVNNFIIEEITTVQDGRVKVTPTGYVRVSTNQKAAMMNF